MAGVHAQHHAQLQDDCRRFEGHKASYKSGLEAHGRAFKKVTDAIHELDACIKEYDKAYTGQPTIRQALEAWMQVCRKRHQIGAYGSVATTMRLALLSRIVHLKGEENRLIARCAGLSFDWCTRAGGLQAIGVPASRTMPQRFARHLSRYGDAQRDADIKWWIEKNRVPLCSALLKLKEPPSYGQSVATAALRELWTEAVNDPVAIMNVARGIGGESNKISAFSSLMLGVPGSLYWKSWSRAELGLFRALIAPPDQRQAEAQRDYYDDPDSSDGMPPYLQPGIPPPRPGLYREHTGGYRWID